MKILSAQQIREADAYTIKHEPIASIDLMERAANACFQWIYDRAPKLFPSQLDERDYVFYVICGVGNNGGDGLVIARLLSRNGYEVKVVIVEFSKNYSEDFSANLAKLKKTKVPIEIANSAEVIPDIPPGALVIDALFGTGLARPAEGLALLAIQNINASGARVVSVDMPSGLFAEDNRENDYQGVVRAHHVLTFQFPKLAFLLGDTARLCGKVEVLDIGLHRDFTDKVETPYFCVSDEWVRQRILPRERFGHKGTFGHVAVVAGSYGMMGAAVLCSRSALQGGAGAVTAFVPEVGVQVVQTAVPEVMVKPVGDHAISGDKFPPKEMGAWAIGPGIGTQKDTGSWLKAALAQCDAPLVLDADALNILSENKAWLKSLPADTILTPHPGEFRRLAGDWSTNYERLQLLREFASNHKVYVVLKGANTSTATPDGDVFFNTTGNSGMATAGSGDSLTGIIASLRAQGYAARDAAVIGVFLHGRAGDLAALEHGEHALIASHITQFLGNAFLSLNLPQN
ncbi:MAG: NAD(P)H-hydrate dehydratase [Cryomorphaceae bacterium]|nr:MAG: NAD(P)H-hydrate dehydratase [Cryomorphaceae bacterium]